MRFVHAFVNLVNNKEGCCGPRLLPEHEHRIEASGPHLYTIQTYAVCLQDDVYMIVLRYLEIR